MIRQAPSLDSSPQPNYTGFQPGGSQQLGKSLLLLGLIAAWCWFSFLSSGHLGLDSRNRYEVTRNIVAGNGPVSPTYGSIAIIKGGETYRFTRYHLGQSIMLIPIHVGMILPLEAVLPEHLEARAGELLLAVVVFPFFGALSLLFFGLFLQRLGASSGRMLGVCAALALCTPFLWYGAMPHETSQIFLLVSLAAFLAIQKKSHPRDLLLAGFLLTTTTWFKPLLTIDVGCLAAGITLLLRAHNTDRWRQKSGFLWLGFALGGLLSLSLFFWDNWFRFGHPLRTCYQVWFEQHGLVPFSMPLAKGFFGQVLSLDFGLLWLCPLIFAIRHKGMKMPQGAHAFWMAAWIAYLASVLLHARYISYAGSHAIGPRFQMHLLPFLCLPLAFMPIRRGIAVLLIYGFLVALSTKALSPSLELTTNPRRFSEIDFAEEAPFELPGIYGDRVANLSSKARGDLTERITTRNQQELSTFQQSLLRWDFYWARAFQQSAKLGWLFTLFALTQLAVAIGLARYIYVQASASAPGPSGT